MRTVVIGRDLDLDETVVLATGRPFTNADTEAEADAIEAEARRGGRPSLAEGVSPQVAFRVPAALKAQLRDAARASGRTEAAIAREALREHLARVA